MVSYFLLSCAFAAQVMQLDLNHGKSKRRHLEAVSEVTNTDDTYYTTNFYFGSNLQQIELIIDTGSIDVWFAGPDCPSPSKCDGEIFDSGASNTFEQSTNRK